MNNLYRMYKFMQDTQEINTTSLAEFSGNTPQENELPRVTSTLIAPSTLPVSSMPYCSNQYSSLYTSNKLESQTQFVHIAKESVLGVSMEENQQYLSNHLVQLAEQPGQHTYEVIRSSCQLLSSNLNYHPGEPVTPEQSSQYQVIKQSYDKTLH